MTGAFCRALSLGLFLSTCAVGSLVHAAETSSFSYDAEGRLIGVAKSGTINDGVASSYSYDDADNRTNVTVTTGGTPAAPSFAISNASVTEGGTLSFTVTKSGTTSSTLTLDYATSNGTATAGSDYTAKSSSLSFAPADTSKTVTVVTIDDSAVESSETVNVNLTNASGGATISDNLGVGTINDNDSTSQPCSNVSFAINDQTVTEGASFTFTVTKSGSTSSSCGVSYATANGTATAGSDYTAKSGTLSFSASATSKSVTVATTDDSTVESAETLTVGLSSATNGASISDATGAGTINDNDTATPDCSGVSFAVNNTSAIEGNPLIFTVSKAGSTSSSCSVNYATADGTATGGTGPMARYLITSGTLTFTSGQTSQTVSVTTRANFTTDFNQTMYLNLSGQTSGSTLSDSQGQGTILDDGNGCTYPCTMSATPEDPPIELIEEGNPDDPPPATEPESPPESP